MIVNRKDGNGFWEDLEGASSRLSGSSLGEPNIKTKTYLFNNHCHRLYVIAYERHRPYGEPCEKAWGLNNKSLTALKTP